MRWVGKEKGEDVNPLHYFAIIYLQPNPAAPEGKLSYKAPEMSEKDERKDKRTIAIMRGVMYVRSKSNHSS